MAGHSQFKNIMHRKGAQDAKRAKLFAKLTRELMVAVKSGLPDPEANPRLRSALSAARSANMPKDNIDRAIKKALGNDADTNYDEVRYEGYGPGGIAVIVETLTDNRNRSASEIRSAFSKHGGNLGETGSVSFQFERIGFIAFPKSIASFDDVFDQSAQVGADNVEETDEHYEISCAVEEFGQVRDALIRVYGDPLDAKIIWRPTNTISADLETAQKLMKLVDVLEDNDDVQNVYTNVHMDDSIIKSLT